MNAVDITSVVIAVMTVLSTLVIPPILRRRKATEAAGATEVVSWKGITAVLQEERDALRKQLNAIETEYKGRLHTIEIEYTAQLVAAKQRISQLEAEVQQLYMQLYQHQLRPPIPPPPGAPLG